MRKLTCEECGKHYDYDVDDFCPKCGAFNRPAQRDATRVESINEDNHQGSFAHAEFHDENLDRRKSGLSGSVRRVPQSEATVSAVAPSQRTREQPIKEKDTKWAEFGGDLASSIKKILFYFIAGIVGLNILGSLLRFL